ncbi:MAG TPA: 2OG-Fe(II) oxygenase [Steroidobacteraceae bacterium]|jgi:SM-20-related protein|nr:2OG-Fe(II) oxygenase [Steroidobacteraceae bacterium]
MATEAESRETPVEAAGPQEPADAVEASRRTSSPARPISALIEQLATRGFGIVDDFVAGGLLGDLRARCLSLHAAGGLRQARVGRGAQEREAPEVRGDFIAWLSEPELDAEQQLLAKLEELRIALNRGLMAGLEDFQGHFALYPSGAAYARHVDRLAGTDVRAISVALYLNEDWAAGDGGALRIYTGGGASEDVLPRGGRLVAFQSERFEHEVLPATRERLSFTGWYRRRPLEGFV